MSKPGLQQPPVKLPLLWLYPAFPMEKVYKTKSRTTLRPALSEHYTHGDPGIAFRADNSHQAKVDILKSRTQRIMLMNCRHKAWYWGWLRKQPAVHPAKIKESRIPALILSIKGKGHCPECVQHPGRFWPRRMEIMAPDPILINIPKAVIL